MSETMIKHLWLKDRSELPGRLVIDTVYHIADEGVMVIDHGKGPVEFGAKKPLDTLDGNETDRSPSVQAVKAAIEPLKDGALFRGAFTGADTLAAAYPMDEVGAYATVLSTGTTWIWDGAKWADTQRAPLHPLPVDNLTTPDAAQALSANQGVELKGQIDGLAQDLGDAMDTMASAAYALTILKKGWTRDASLSQNYPWTQEIPHGGVDEGMTPLLTVLPASAQTALEAGLCPVIRTVNGAVRLFSGNKPGADMEAVLTLYGRVTLCELTLPGTGWTRDRTRDYEWSIDVPCEAVGSGMTPILTVKPDSVKAAVDCGLSPACQTVNGALRVFAAREPAAAMSCELSLRGGAKGLLSDDTSPDTEQEAGDADIQNIINSQYQG